MAFVVPTKRGTFEVRESFSTDKGPRSRTLATFKELDDEVLDKASARAENTLDYAQLRRSAQRAGATVARKPIEQAARGLITELARGRRLEPGLRQILLEMLQKDYRDDRDASPENEAAHSVAMWMAATPEQRGRALVDLLLLVDALPPPDRKDKPLRFPRLDSGGQT